MQMLYKHCAKQGILCFFLTLQDFVENYEKRIDIFPLASLKTDSEDTGKMSKNLGAQSEVNPTAPYRKEKK